MRLVGGGLQVMDDDVTLDHSTHGGIDELAHEEGIGLTKA